MRVGEQGCSIKHGMTHTLPSSGLDLGPDEVGHKSLKLLHLCRSQKIQNLKLKFFFHCRLEDLPSLLSVCTAL